MPEIQDLIKKYNLVNQHIEYIKKIKILQMSIWFKSKAMIAVNKNGGIDLTPAYMNLQAQDAGKAIKFYLDPAMIRGLQNAPGFVPVIISIQPLNNPQQFLGLSR